MEELDNLPIFYNIPLYHDDTVTNNLYNSLFNLDFNNNDTTTLESVINSSFNESPLYKQIIDDTELSKIINSKSKYIKNNEFDNTETENSNTFCPITQEEFVDQQDIITLECNHSFEPEAILHWLKEEKSECPVCRFKYKSKEVKETKINSLQENRENLYTSLSRVNVSNFYTYFI